MGNVDAEHHSSRNSECGIMGYSSCTGLKNNNDNKEERKSFASIHRFSPLSIVPSISFTSLKIKSIWCKNKTYIGASGDRWELLR